MQKDKRRSAEKRRYEYMKGEPIRKRLQTESIIVKSSPIVGKFNAHSHDFFELSMCISGHITHRINGKSYDFDPGDILLLTPTDIHSEFAKDNSNTIQVHFKENMLDENTVNLLLNYGADPIFRFDEKTAQNMKSLLLLLLDEYESGGADGEYLQRLFECMMLLFMRASDINKSKYKSTSPIQKSLTYLNMHFRESPTLEEVARICNMSKTYFCSMFKEYTGVGFVKYLNVLKLNYARRLLTSTSVSITEICYRSGFNSESNFLRAFKQEFGMPAQKYRTLHKSSN